MVHTKTKELENKSVNNDVSHLKLASVLDLNISQGVNRSC
jgi:hypothetical protein